MSHDPLCPAWWLPKPYPGEVVVEEWHARACRCRLIAAVRQRTLDEAAAAVEELRFSRPATLRVSLQAAEVLAAIAALRRAAGGET